MDDTCAVCAEPLKWVAYGQCGHRDVCSDCVSRLRFICDDRKCCICKTESDVVFVTKALGDYTMRIADFSVFPVDPTEGRVGQYWYHEGTKAFFDDSDHFKMIKATCKFSCAVCDNSNVKTDELGEERPKRAVNFRTIEQLKSHLYHNHKLFMCVLCLEGRKVFIREQKLYTRKQLNQHIRSGDSEVDGSEYDRGGFMGHPMCKFCETPFYGENELYTHMHTQHYTCHICQKANPGQFDYFKDYNELERHFLEDHFLCEDEGCLAKKFVVFTSESDLKRHSALEHRGQMSRSERNSALQVPTSFRYNNSRRQTLRLDLSNNEARTQVEYDPRSSLSDYQAESRHTNTDQQAPLPASSEPDNSAFQTGPPPRIEQASFPPLPSNPLRPKPPQIDNTMASRIRRRNKPHLVPRTWPPPTPTLTGPPLNYGNVTSPSGPATSLPSNSTALVLVTPSSSPITSLSATGNGVVVSRQPTPAVTSASSPAMSASKVISSDTSSSGSSHPPSSMARVLMASSAAATSLSATNRKDNKTSFEPSLSNFPPVSATITKKTVAKSSESKQEDIQSANKLLIEEIRVGLGFDDEKFGAFKVISAEYRQGLIETEEYVAYVHQFGISNLIPELARLCPDSQKRKELLMACNISKLRDDGIRISEGRNMIELKLKKDSSKKGKERMEDSTINSFASSKKGKEKIEDSIISSVRELHSSYRPVNEVEVLSKNGYRSNKGNLKVDEPPGLNFTDLTLRGESQESEPLKKVGGVKKQQKKMSKFDRNRLGDDYNPTLGGDSSDQVEKSPVGSVWQNGGGIKLVNKLVVPKRGTRF